MQTKFPQQNQNEMHNLHSLYYGHTPLWDAYYVRAQNKKFKNKWEKLKSSQDFK